MKYRREKDLYPEVINWFKQMLHNRFKRSKISVYDTSQVALWKFLSRKGLTSFFKDYLTFDIQVDITAVVKSNKGAKLAFIECKLKPITLRDVSQLLGYSKVANPFYSLIISPAGISRSVNYLFNTFNRFDIVEYSQGRKMKIAKWDLARKSIDIPSLLPRGEYL